MGDERQDKHTRTNLAATGTSTARLLALATRRCSAEALSIVHENGYHAVREADLALMRNLDLEGTRLTELAQRARMTKQSMRELVDRAEHAGLVWRASDPEDARAKRVLFTETGLSFLEQMRIGLVRAEEGLAQATATGFVTRLKSGLSRFILANLPQ